MITFFLKDTKRAKRYKELMYDEIYMDSKSGDHHGVAVVLTLTIVLHS